MAKMILLNKKKRKYGGNKMKMNVSKQDFTVPVITSIFYLVMVAMNALANILPFNGQTTGEISDAYANLFAPAGITFSIWGVIYILLGLYCIYQVFMARRSESYARLKIQRINVLFIVTSIANTLWIIAWHNEWMVVSLALIIIILVGLIMIKRQTARYIRGTKHQWFIDVPFSVYFGWITIATIANVVVVLVGIGWEGFGLSDSFWMIVVSIIGVLIGGWTMTKYRDVFYGLVILWAYVGILIKHTSATGFSGQYPAIIVTISFCIVALVALLGNIFRLTLFGKRDDTKKKMEPKKMQNNVKTKQEKRKKLSEHDEE